MKKGDIIAAIIILFLVCGSFVGVYVYKQHIKGTHHIAVIKQDGKIIKTIDLDTVKRNSEFKVYYQNTHYNTIDVQPGKIHIVDADCPDKLCVKTGWLSQPGQTAVCPPHKLVITIEGKNSEVDDVVF